VGAGFLAAGLFVAQALLLSDVVDRIFLRRQTLGSVRGLLVLMLALLVLRGGLIWAEALLSQRASSRVKGSLRSQISRHFFALGPAYVHGERTGELVNAAVEGVETLDDYISQFLPARYLAGLVPAMVFLIVLILDPLTTVVYLLAGPFLVLLLALIGGRAQAITERRFGELSWLSAHFLDMLQGLPTLKLYGRSREQRRTIEEISRHYGETTMEVLRTAFQTSLVQEWAATAATALVALEVSLRLMGGGLPFFQALAVLLLTPEFFLPLRQMSLKYHAGTAGKTAAARIYAILDTPPQRSMHRPQPAEPQPDGSGDPGGRLPAGRAQDPLLPALLGALGAPSALPLRCDVRFAGVDYAYEGGARPALRGLSFTIPHGQTVALVGPTGAGKSTVAALLMGFIAPDTGEITVGGVRLDSLDPAAWRTQVAWVPQAPHLFHGTVADNIRLARPGAGPDEVVAAARAAHAHDFIQALPRGYDTPVGEDGARLSGGQRQRLALARAFLKDAPLLILDEATVHLDAASEALIRDALRRLMRVRTVLVIAHRLELAYEAAQVVVLDGGRAVAAGSHAHLLAEGGLYGQLVATYKAGGGLKGGGGT
jgi:thiol reductant ABC exporter CydD subunit